MQFIIIIACIMLHSFSPGDTVGFTDYDGQPPGSMGRYVWMTCAGGYSFLYVDSYTLRRPYYNYHFPPSYWVGPVLLDIDQIRIGALEQMSDGRALVSAYASVPGGYVSRVYLDASEGAGMFTIKDLPGGGSTTCPIWPKPCVDDNDYIYVVASQNGGPYSWWTMSTDEGDSWTPWDSSLAGVVLNTTNFFPANECWAHSTITPWIALVNNMIDDYYTIVYWETGDQGDTWYYDTIYCMGNTAGDSVWGFFWHSACYDNNENLHVVFNCIDTVLDGGVAPFSGVRSQIRHWSKQTGQISIVDNGLGWVGSNPGPGPFHPTVSEPQITIDRATGNLYCTWCYANPEDTAANGWVNNDIWGAKSTDNGATWIEQHNITNSPSPGALSGYCDNDHMNHLTEETLGDTLAIFYMNDKDAGFGTFTDNPLLFYLYEWNPPGVQENITKTLMRYSLNVVPNPVIHHSMFNYTLSESGKYTLKLFDVCGRVLTTLEEGTKPAGKYTTN